jgi:hypothetical protein
MLSPSDGSIVAGNAAVKVATPLAFVDAVTGFPVDVAVSAEPSIV